MSNDNTGHREPHARFVTEDPVHSGEKVDHVAVLDHHAFGFPGRARGVDHVRQVPAFHAAGRFRRRIFAVRIDQDGPDAGRGEPVLDLLRYKQQSRFRILQHELQPLDGIGGIHRQVGGPRLQYAQQADHHFERAVGAYRYDLLRSRTQLPQAVRQARCLLIQLAVSKRLPAKYHGRSVRGAARLLFHQVVNTLASRDLHVSGVPAGNPFVAAVMFRLGPQMRGI